MVRYCPNDEAWFLSEVFQTPLSVSLPHCRNITRCGRNDQHPDAQKGVRMLRSWTSGFDWAYC
jgi:hypothetical protein